MAGLYGSQRRLVWLWLTLEALDESLKLDTIDDRIKLQKLVYLAQAATGALAYHFNPYIRGPYSPTLTRDLYGLLEPGRENEAKERADAYKLSSSTIQELETAKLVSNTKCGINYVRWLELIASLHYMHVHEDRGGGFDKAWNGVKTWKADIFNEKEARAAWSSLEQHRLVST